MAINLVTKFLPYVDEIFTTESKKALLTMMILIGLGHIPSKFIK